MTIPSHIGQYRIVRKIGAGGMGMVFLGEHTLLGRRAAIKTLLPTVAVNQEIVERFFNEARAASAISDPGVIQIFDFGYHVDGTAYIVMELLQGEALSTRIDRMGKLPLPDAIRIARQIAGSLAAAHACQIVHRDLKPENIFLVRDSEAQGGERTKILDFGICKVGSAPGDVSVTQVGAMVGTPVYMSPEQCRGAGDVDHRSDIYAFGCLLFHVLTGRPPFIGESSGDLIVAHMQADPPAPSLYIAGLPFEVDALLLRCLAKSPDDRFSSMTELHLVLGDIHAQLDGTESTIASVTPEMQLGQGFRSVYNANFSAFTHGASRISPPTHRLRPQLRFIATPPATPPRMRAMTSRPGQDTDDDIAALLRPRRTLRAMFICILAVGIGIGLASTPLVRQDDERTAVAGSAPMVREPDVPAAVAGMPDPVASTSEAPSPRDRTVERTSAASDTAEPLAMRVGPIAESASIAQSSEKAVAAPVADRSPSGKAAAEPAADTSTSETSAGKPSPGEKPVASAVEAGPVTTPSGTPAESEPVVAPPEADPPAAEPSPGLSSGTMVTTLKKPDAASTPDPPRRRESLRETRPIRSRSSAAKPPPPPPPSRPPPSNEDLYDTR